MSLLYKKKKTKTARIHLWSVLHKPLHFLYPSKRIDRVAIWPIKSIQSKKKNIMKKTKVFLFIFDIACGEERESFSRPRNLF